MNSELETSVLTEAPQTEPSLIASIKQIQKHLVFLEKKIDTLIEQTKGRSFNKGNSFSRPQGNQFSRPQGQFSRPQGNSFSRPYKSFDRNRSGHLNQENRFDKPWGDNRGNFRNKKRKFRGGPPNHGRSTFVRDRFTSSAPSR